MQYITYFQQDFKLYKRERDEDFLKKTSLLIKNANICDKIGRIGFNFAFFSNELEKIKNKILKDDFSKNYNGFSITFSQEINNYCKLTLRLAEGIKRNPQENTTQKGMIVDANFDQVINQENTTDKAFAKNYSELVKSYIKNIF